MHLRVERVARRRGDLLGVERLLRRPQAPRLPGAVRPGHDLCDAVRVRLRVGGAAVDPVDGAGERVVGVFLRPALGRGLRDLDRRAVGEREDHLRRRARVEHEGLEGRGDLARPGGDDPAGRALVDDVAGAVEAEHVPPDPLAELRRAPEHGVVAVARVGVGHEDVRERRVARGRHLAAVVPPVGPDRGVEPGGPVGEPDVRRELRRPPACRREGLLGVGSRGGRGHGRVAAPRHLPVDVEPARVVGVVVDPPSHRERPRLRREGARRREGRGGQGPDREQEREQRPHGRRRAPPRRCRQTRHRCLLTSPHDLKGAPTRPSPSPRRRPLPPPRVPSAPGRPGRAPPRSACAPRRARP